MQFSKSFVLALGLIAMISLHGCGEEPEEAPKSENGGATEIQLIDQFLEKPIETLIAIDKPAAESEDATEEVVAAVEAQEVVSSEDDKQIAEIKAKMGPAMVKQLDAAGAGAKTVADKLKSIAVWNTLCKVFTPLNALMSGLAAKCNPASPGKRIVYKSLAMWIPIAIVYALAYFEHWDKRYFVMTGTFASGLRSVVESDKFPAGEEWKLYYGYNDHSYATSWTGKECYPYQNGEEVTAAGIASGHSYQSYTPMSEYKCISSSCWVGSHGDDEKERGFHMSCLNKHSQLSLIRLIRVIANATIVGFMILSVYALHMELVYKFGKLDRDSRRVLFPFAMIIAVLGGLFAGFIATGFSVAQPDQRIVEKFSIIGAWWWVNEWTADDAFKRSMFYTFCVILLFTFPIVLDFMALFASLKK